MTFRHATYACLLCLFVVACGGDGGSDTTASEAEQASETEEGEADSAARRQPVLHDKSRTGQLISSVANARTKPTITPAQMRAYTGTKYRRRDSIPG